MFSDYRTCKWQNRVYHFPDANVFFLISTLYNLNFVIEFFLVFFLRFFLFQRKKSVKFVNKCDTCNTCFLYVWTSMPIECPLNFYSTVIDQYILFEFHDFFCLTLTIGCSGVYTHNHFIKQNLFSIPISSIKVFGRFNDIKMSLRDFEGMNE